MRGDITKHVMSVLVTSHNYLTQGDIKRALLDRDLILEEGDINNVLQYKHKIGVLKRERVINPRSGHKTAWGYAVSTS